MARITKEDSYEIKIYALAGWTPQEIAIKYKDKDYSATQIRNHINRKYGKELNGKFKKDTSRGNIILKNLLDEIFPQAKVEVEYPIGKGLRLDCYIGGDYNLGFEYDGIQHKKSINHFGGDEAYIRGVQNDQLKEELCDGRGISLIRINHNESLSLESLTEKIENTTWGTGHIKDGFYTPKEKHRFKKEKVNKNAKEKRKENYKKQKESYKKSEAYKKQKEKARKIQRENYRKQKEWASNRKNRVWPRTTFPFEPI